MILYLNTCIVLSNFGTWKLELRSQTQPLRQSTSKTGRQQLKSASAPLVARACVSQCPKKNNGTGVPLGTGSLCHFTARTLAGPVQDRSGPVRSRVSLVRSSPGPVSDLSGPRSTSTPYLVLGPGRSSPVRSCLGPIYTPRRRTPSFE